MIRMPKICKQQDFRIRNSEYSSVANANTFIGDMPVAMAAIGTIVSLQFHVVRIFARFADVTEIGLS